MLFMCGDTHGNLRRFTTECFPEQKEMTRDDFVFICGDFGCLWDGSKEEKAWLDWLDAKPFTTLFVDGNHENFTLLNSYPVSNWQGGKVRRIRDNVLQLMRGQVFDIGGYTFFAMGGAASHDIADGILDPTDPAFRAKRRMLDARGGMYRVKGKSWWPEEMPCAEEYVEAMANLDRVGWKVDYVITHCGPSGVVDVIGKGGYAHDRLTDFFDMVSKKLEFRYWIFGHYHDNRAIGQNYILLWEQILQID